MIGKKGFIGDVLTGMLFLFVIAVVVLCGYLIMSRVNTAFQGLPDAQMPERAKDLMSSQTAAYTQRWDSFYGFMIVAITLALMVSAFILDVHPVFFVITIILMGIFIGIGAVISNSYYAVESSTTFASFAEDFVIMSYIMTHLPIYLMAQGFVVAIALYAKSRV